MKVTSKLWSYWKKNFTVCERWDMSNGFRLKMLHVVWPEHQREHGGPRTRSPPSPPTKCFIVDIKPETVSYITQTMLARQHHLVSARFFSTFDWTTQQHSYLITQVRTWLYNYTVLWSHSEEIDNITTQMMIRIKLWKHTYTEVWLHRYELDNTTTHMIKQIIPWWHNCTDITGFDWSHMIQF